MSASAGASSAPPLLQLQLGLFSQGSGGSHNSKKSGAPPREKTTKLAHLHMHLRLRHSIDAWGFRQPVLEWARAREVAAMRKMEQAAADQWMADAYAGQGPGVGEMLSLLFGAE